VLSLRFLRDRTAEMRPDFGGYRVYRMINTPDTSRAVLLRRFSINPGSELTWKFSTVDSAGNFHCPPGPPLKPLSEMGPVVNDSIVTFVDPDSNGTYVKVCRRTDGLNGTGRCLSPGDSVFVLWAPPGPHDGFRTWYTITYEKRNTTDTDYEDLFVPDTTGNFARCDTTGMGLAAYDTTNVLMFNVRNTCPNLNTKALNLVGPAEPTAGPTANLEQVLAVPNPFRASEAWDQAAQNEIHFINLPKVATIKIFTVSGDLVRTLSHNDSIRDFERWDLKSGAGQPVASGIYLYRVESAAYAFQNRLIIIR
jgi:hypothetical protein